MSTTTTVEEAIYKLKKSRQTNHGKEANQCVLACPDLCPNGQIRKICPFVGIAYPRVFREWTCLYGCGRVVVGAVDDPLEECAFYQLTLLTVPNIGEMRWHSLAIVCNPILASRMSVKKALSPLFTSEFCLSELELWIHENTKLIPPLIRVIVYDYFAHPLAPDPLPLPLPSPATLRYRQ